MQKSVCFAACFLFLSRTSESELSLFAPKTKNPAYAGLFHLSAERTLPISNLKPLNELELSRLEKPISPHRIQGLDDGAVSDIFLRDLAAINDFLFYLEAEPFITTNMTESRKRVPIKKSSNFLRLCRL